MLNSRDKANTLLGIGLQFKVREPITQEVFVDRPVIGITRIVLICSDEIAVPLTSKGQNLAVGRRRGSRSCCRPSLLDLRLDGGMTQPCLTFVLGPQRDLYSAGELDGAAIARNVDSQATSHDDLLDVGRDTTAQVVNTRVWVTDWSRHCNNHVGPTTKNAKLCAARDHQPIWVDTKLSRAS